jgi:bifunctional ADP-heptose synthase (sugar kinase/adenylyltransferase)
MHDALHKHLHHLISLITLSERGIYYQSGQESSIIPSHVRNVADVSGAGDTVIAVASLVFAVTRNARLMAEIANIAGGLVCEEVGTAAIDPVRLKEEAVRILGDAV